MAQCVEGSLSRVCRRGDDIVERFAGLDYERRLIAYCRESVAHAPGVENLFEARHYNIIALHERRIGLGLTGEADKFHGKRQ